MKKQLYFYALLGLGILLCAAAGLILGFLIYFICAQMIAETVIFAVLLPVFAGGGAIVIVFSQRTLKNMVNISTIATLYPDFNPTENFVINTQGFRRSSLLIDPVSKKFVFILSDSIVPAYRFDDILYYEVFENGYNVHTGDRLNAGKEKFLGSVGIRGSNVLSDHVSTLQAVIKVNDPQSPQIVINYLGLKGVDRLNSDYRDYINAVSKLCLKLDFMLTRSAPDQSKTSDLDKLQELKVMLERGLITPEEYAIKKRKILGI